MYVLPNKPIKSITLFSLSINNGYCLFAAVIPTDTDETERQTETDKLKTYFAPKTDPITSTSCMDARTLNQDETHSHSFKL